MRNPAAAPPDPELVEVAVGALLDPVLEPIVEMVITADEQQRQCREIEAGDPGGHGVAEEQSSRAHADQGIVLPVLEGIDGVVAQGPTDAGEVDHGIGQG